MLQSLVDSNVSLRVGPSVCRGKLTSHRSGLAAYGYVTRLARIDYMRDKKTAKKGMR